MMYKMLVICQALSGCLDVFYDTVYIPSVVSKCEHVMKKH